MKIDSESIDWVSMASISALSREVEVVAVRVVASSEEVSGFGEIKRRL